MKTVEQDIIAPDPSLVTATSYPFATFTGIALEDMSSGTTQLVAASQDDTASPVTNIGFDYWYDGVRATQFSVNANGLLHLGATSISTGFTNSLASTTDAPKIGAFWDDLCTGTNGKVHYKVTGSAPNRKLIVEWQNMQITRGAGCAGAGTGTFQAWLFETSGVIEFVYGSGLTTSADGGYSVGLQSGAATNFASVTTSTNTVSYATANDTQTTAITAGRAYTFTPNAPLAPTGLSFTNVNAASVTLNWTDNATNEVGYAIFQSTDGVNYTFITQTAANATSQVIGGLVQNTNYFFNVYAVTEGGVSSALSGSQMTPASGNITANVAGGNWSAPATWAGGVVPTIGDNVTIPDGATVTIDTAASAYSLTIGTGGAAAVLQFEQTAVRTLTVAQGVSIASNGTFQSNTAGSALIHSLVVGTDLTNNGILDFSTLANTAGAGITFLNSSSNTFGGTGATTDIRTLTINKGSSSASVLELNPTNFTVQGVSTDSTAAAFLTLTNGTLKVSGTFTASFRTFPAAAYTIPATGGFWLNNPNYTVTGQNASPTNNGLLRVSQGTFNIGSASGNAMGAGAGAAFTFEGGTVNIAGRLNTANAVTYTQSGGTVNVCTVGNASSLTYSFAFTAGSFNMSGGTINLVQTNSTATAANRRDYEVISSTNITGGTLNVGTAATATNFDFRLFGFTPNIVTNNTTNNKNAIAIGPGTSGSTALIFLGDATISTGTLLNLNNFLVVAAGTNFVNNGTINGTAANSRLYFQGSGPQTYSGSGGVTAPALSSFDLDNAAGLTINPAATNIITTRVDLFTGSLTNSNKITLGTGSANSTIQIGNVTTPTAAGTFDVPLTFNLGTGGEIVQYLRTTTSRTTGGEINPTRTLLSTTRDDNDSSHTLTIAGGDLTLSNTATALTLTNGRIVTGSNTLILSSGTATVTRTAGYVDGNLRKNYTGATSKTFEVGTANGYSPVTANVTAGTGTLTVKATQGPQPNLPGPNALQRYWTLTGPGLTANLTFQYLAADPVGNEASYHVFRYNGSFTDLVGTINTGADTASVNGVASLDGDWTAAEPGSEVLRSMTINDVSSVETDSGMHNVTFTVNLSSASALNAMASWATAPGTAQSPDDFVASGGVVTVTAGNTMQTFTVPVKGDVLDEANENFFVNLTSPSNATIADATGVCTIIDDDINSGDLDGDGKNDPSVVRPDDGAGNSNWYVLNSGDNSVTQQQFGASTDIPVGGDFNGDGKKDIAVYRPNDDGLNNSAFYVSKGSAQNFDKYIWGVAADIPVPGDYDGDTKSDAAVFRKDDPVAGSGTWYVRKSDGTLLVAQQWGLSTDKPVPADYDGDGKTDFAVFRNDDPIAGSGTWYILRSSDGGYTIAQWGFNTDKLVPADYDLDGKADIAVWRDSDGIWYVRRSSDGGLTTAQWGQSGDVPVVGDYYDGDGKADFAVWRPSTGIFLIRRSADGNTDGPQWGLSTDVPVASKYIPQQ